MAAWAAYAGIRLNEVALHSWDVRVATDEHAGLLASSVETLLEHLAGDLGFLLGFLGKADRIAERVVLALGDSGFALVVDDSVALATADGATARFEGPVEAALRLISGRQNLRLATANGSLVATDTAPFYVPNDTNYLPPPAFQTPNIVSMAYTKTGSPTLFALDSNTQSLVRVGGVGGSPSASTGQLFTIGQVGVSFGPNTGLYIGNNGIAWAVLAPNGAGALLYNIDLNSGSVSLINKIGDGTRTIVALVVNS